MSDTEKKKILSIEDNPANRKIVHDFLSIRGGYNVIDAVDGLEGLEKVKKEKPDLILTDIQLPGMDGLQVIKAIREDPDPSISTIPIIVLSSYAMKGDSEKGYAAGCDAYFTKPLALKQLMETVKNLLEAKHKKT
jgi:CheY-like chemotaxis protein